MDAYTDKVTCSFLQPLSTRLYVLPYMYLLICTHTQTKWPALPCSLSPRSEGLSSLFTAHAGPYVCVRVCVYVCVSQVIHVYRAQLISIHTYHTYIIYTTYIIILCTGLNWYVRIHIIHTSYIPHIQYTSYIPHIFVYRAQLICTHTYHTYTIYTTHTIYIIYIT